jgi:signal peptidase I
MGAKTLKLPFSFSLPTGIDMTSFELLTIWLISSLSFLMLLHTLKNGRGQKFRTFMARRVRARSYRRKRAYSKEYLRLLRSKVIKSKPLRAFLPLMIMLVVVVLLLNNFVYFTVITSDSMSPTFSRGDMVLMTKHKDVEAGDVIMFTVPQEPFPVVHRVSRIEEENISTKGDFNPVEDHWVINNSVIQSEAVTISGDPVVLKGIGTYFIEDYEAQGKYSGEIEINRLILQGMKSMAIFIFFSAVFLYIFFTYKDLRQRKVS